MYQLKKYWENEHVNNFSIPSTEVNTIFLSFATSDVTQKCKAYLVHESCEKNPRENGAFSEAFTWVSVFEHAMHFNISSGICNYSMWIT